MEESLKFLKLLSQNNHKEWFHDNKSTYDSAKNAFKALVGSIEEEMNTFDALESRPKIFRINRDIRFSKDKTPYNTSFRASFKRAGMERRGGYFLRLEPGKTAIAGGFFGPNPQDLLHIRKQLQQEHESLRDIITRTDFQEYFGDLYGEKVKTAPKGFKKDDPAIDFLQMKQFLVRHEYTDQEVKSGEFPKKVAEGYRNMLPFFDFMTMILTTDLNGESLT